jgi:hypothetical protein
MEQTWCISSSRWRLRCRRLIRPVSPTEFADVADGPTSASYTIFFYRFFGCMECINIAPVVGNCPALYPLHQIMKLPASFLLSLRRKGGLSWETVPFLKQVPWNTLLHVKIYFDLQTFFCCLCSVKNFLMDCSAPSTSEAMLNMLHRNC